MKGIPPAFKHLMEQCWETVPKNRPSFKDILRVLESLPGSDFFNLPAEYFLEKQGHWYAEIQSYFVHGETQMKKQAQMFNKQQVSSNEAATTSKDSAISSRTSSGKGTSTTQRWKRDTMTL